VAKISAAERTSTTSPGM